MPRIQGRQPVDGEWRARRINVEPELRVEVREGRIERSLWDAVESGAIDAQTIVDLVGILESDFDFASDAQPRDRFRLLVESRYADGEFVEVGRILAARYEADAGHLVGVAFDVDGRLNYYGPEGESLKKTFLRSPLQFTRISSGYTHGVSTRCWAACVASHERPALAIWYQQSSDSLRSASSNFRFCPCSDLY